MQDFDLKGKENLKIVAPDDEVIKFKRTKNDLSDIDLFERFVDAVKKQVRNDDRYDNFIAQLKDQGYTYDVLQSGIDGKRFPNTAIEFHHGPIFNLFDICSIVTDDMLAKGEKVTTFSVAKEVLTAHELGLIQGTMLAKTNHELAECGKVFIHINQCIGDLFGFIKRYKKGLRRDHLYLLEEYFKLCQSHDATDNDYLVLRTASQKVCKYLDKQ